AVPLRQVLASGDVELATVAGRAAQLLEWEAAHTYCGRCGNLTRSHPSELARECQACQQLYFPRIAPVVIMAVRREGELLLAHNRGMREDLYSLLAGFVEVGESLEQAVLREVREEVGLEVGGLRYLASQPWPFPSQLMVGFEARWQGGEIRIQEEELSDAGWFPIDELPPADCLPADYSIASRIIRGLS
ncbi:MAG: NAD(+) diphosphatase, partial [Candidatus Dormibacteraceae bacterium]